MFRGPESNECLNPNSIVRREAEQKNPSCERQRTSAWAVLGRKLPHNLRMMSIYGLARRKHPRDSRAALQHYN